MHKIDKADLFECRYYSSELALLEEQLRTLTQQEQTIRITQAWIEERRNSLQKQLQTLNPKLEGMGKLLEQKYGVEDQDQINWETGEIKPASQTQAAPQPESPGAAPRLGTESFAGVDAAAGVDSAGTTGTEAADPTGAETSDRRRAEGSGPAVE